MKASFIQHNKPSVGSLELAAIKKVISSSKLSMGNETQMFENEFCKKIGLPNGHAIAVSSGTAALYLAFRSIGVANKKIAIPSYTCTAVKNSLQWAGGIPKYIDNKKMDFNVDLDILNADKTIKAALLQHTFGIPMDMNQINTSLPFIEDCCQSLGALYDGKSIGLFGELGVFSFYATKMITTGGQGGMVVSKDKKRIDEIRDFIEFDMKNDNNVRFNFQITDLQSAIGRVQLKKLDSFIQRREEIANKYIDAGIKIYESKKNKKTKQIFYRAINFNNNPNQLIAKCKKQGVSCIIPIEDSELLKKTPNSLELSRNTVSIPVYPTLTNLQVKKIIKSILQ